MTSQTSFAPLPVRSRGTLEIIDTALKLYRRYFGVLMAWSAIIAASWLLGGVAFIAVLTWPLIYGSVACCIAAAVRGQRITFGQVWDFTKPRYGALLLLLLLSALIMSASMIPLIIFMWILTVFTTYLFFIGILSLVPLFLFGILATYLYAFLGLIPIIACLEDDKRGSAAIGRAWELMRGHWTRVLGLSTLLTLAVLAVFGMVGGTVAFFNQGFDAVINDASGDAFLTLMLATGGVVALFFLFWNPIQALILAVLYLDLRVRKEALDLEWASYTSAPPLAENAADAADAANAESADAAAFEAPGAARASTSALAASAPPPLENSEPPAVAPASEGDFNFSSFGAGAVPIEPIQPADADEDNDARA